MVVATDLHFDILSLIFSHVAVIDLVNVALVNKAFLNAAVPRLYHALSYAHSNAKKFPKRVSPFTSILKRPHLAVHVRICDISALPLYKGQPNQEFLSDCIKALDLCPNLSRFRLSPNVLPSFLKTLATKNKLLDLHVNGSLTLDQAEILSSLKSLKSLRLDHGSWCLMYYLPRWVSDLSSSLTSLTFTHCSDINEIVLEHALMRLPNLLTLHVRNCMKLEHPSIFRMLHHTPLLESLSVTTWENSAPGTVGFALLPTLRHLHLDSRNSIVPASIHQLWTNLIWHTKLSRAALTSLTLQLSNPDALTSAMINDILQAYSGSLTTLRLVRCQVEVADVAQICLRCKKLERLALPVPTKHLEDFVSALSLTNSLHTLTDESDPHSHWAHSVLRHADVKLMMEATPKLRTIISENRIWRGTADADDLHITLERQKLNGLPRMVTFP